MDFVMGLPISDEGDDGILMVVDRAMKEVHLILLKQTISASETAHAYWMNIGKVLLVSQQQHA